MIRRILPWVGRAVMTAAAFWWIFKTVEVGKIAGVLEASSREWLLAAVLLYFLAQALCVSRWRLLVPAHPSLTWGFLARSYLIAAFFNIFLPTTVGGDAMRGYDLIKVTGQWREPLASVLLDRLSGFVALAVFAFLGWAVLPSARQDPVIRAGFLGFCLVLGMTFGVLGSRRVWRLLLKPFGKIGLGQLQSHAKQFQEALLDYFRRPKRLCLALGYSLVTQAVALGAFAAVAKGLHLNVPTLSVILIIPIVTLVTQLPISLNGWGIREGVMMLLFGRLGTAPEEAVSFSVISACIPLLVGAVGGILFLTRRRKKPPPA